MQNEITSHLSIHGHFRSGEFPDWICHRATLLGLSGWVNAKDGSPIEVLVQGNPIMVDALEVACSIGPYSVTVDKIETQNSPDCVRGSEFRKV